MKDYRSLSHTKWDCKYHVVFIPKYRRKRIFGKLRGHLGEILHELAKQKQSRIVEGHLRPGSRSHVHQHPAKILGVERRGLYQRLKRAPSQSHETSWVGGGTSPGKVFGRGGTSFLRSVSTRLWSVNTFATKRRKTGGWNSSTSIGRARSRISKTAPFRGRQLRPL